MGMASIPEILNQQMNHQKINYVGIETELIIIDWAKKYVSNTLTQQITWINDDAEKAIYAIKNQFDLICIDVFVHSTVPDFALQINYFEQCKKLLHPNGLLILNVLPNALPLNNNYQQNFELVFKQHKIIPISQNQILVGYN
jgi:spermidine synthase